jgi:hypothetical protein
MATVDRCGGYNNGMDETTDPRTKWQWYATQMAVLVAMRGMIDLVRWPLVYSAREVAPPLLLLTVCAPLPIVLALALHFGRWPEARAWQARACYAGLIVLVLTLPQLLPTLAGAAVLPFALVTYALVYAAATLANRLHRAARPVSPWVRAGMIAVLFLCLFVPFSPQAAVIVEHGLGFASVRYSEAYVRAFPRWVLLRSVVACGVPLSVEQAQRILGPGTYVYNRLSYATSNSLQASWEGFNAPVNLNYDPDGRVVRLWVGR